MALQIPLSQVLFLDIETVSGEPSHAQLSPEERDLWAEKARFWLQSYEGQDDPEALCYNDKAAILAEFGRVVCISVGLLVPGEIPDEDGFRLKSFCGEDEKALLQGFAAMLDGHFSDPNRYFFCGHNIKEFDIPYLCRRMWMKGLTLPAMLDLSGRKPWETKHLLDTMELWKFGDVKHYSSLKLLTHCLGVPSPKDEMDGSQVGHAFYRNKDLASIARYCEKDVLATAQVLRRMMQLPLIAADKVTFGGAL